MNRAEKAAAQLSAKSKAYLLGDAEGPASKALADAGCVDDGGRLTPFGVWVARVVADQSRWTKDDSAVLDAEIRESRKPRPARRYADPELADACRKILAYRLKGESRHTRGSAVPGFGINQPSRAFS